jgi:hypothetical protein
MQLLIQTTAPDYAAWKARFDADSENIAAAGLQALQIWKGDGVNVLVLFEVSNSGRAREWLDKRAAFGDQMTAQFLETV